MALNPVIVESSAKVRTVKKFLGSNYVVDASQGCVRDPPKSQLGVDVKHGYEPKYITIRRKGDVLAKFREEVKRADKIYPITNPDREGEAISWHPQKALKLEEIGRKVYRITFNEITKDAACKSIRHPRKIDMDLVDARQTCRILDRMVGYSISPLFWAEMKRGLSIGRTQSVALCMICDHEAEIKAFALREYWSFETVTHAVGDKRLLKACHYGVSRERMELHSEAECLSVIKNYKGKPLLVQEIKESERNRKAPLPFTTSTLQQETSKRLNFST